MNTISGYLSWRGDLPFQQIPYNEVDAYILAKIGSPDLTGVVPASGEGIALEDAYSQYFSRTDIDPDYLGRLNQPILSKTLRRLPETDRFGELVLSDYIRKTNTAVTEQISALTISLPGGPTVITFRGTDDTIVGWKENFLMAVHSAIPAQDDALAYLTHMAEKHPGPLAVIGHSKGGNLAVYASVMASEEIRSRITRVYNFDGPGMLPEFWLRPEANEMQNRIFNYVSQHTLVGALLMQSNNLIVCRSNRSGPLAHEAMFWEVMGPAFVREETVSTASAKFGELMNAQMDQMSDDEVIRFADDLFGALTSTGAATLTDLSHLSSEQKLHILKEINNKDSMREFEKDLAGLLIQERERPVYKLVSRTFNKKEDKNDT